LDFSPSAGINIWERHIIHDAMMNRKGLLSRIVLDPKVMAGKPIIKGTRLTVQHILNLLAHGETTDDILKEYTELKRDDIQACLLYASATLGDATVMPLEEAA